MSVVCINTNLSSFRKLAKEMNVSTQTLHDALSIWWNVKEQQTEPTQEDLWAIISPKEVVVPNQAVMEQCNVGNIANLINLIKNVVKDNKGVTVEKLQEELGIPITAEELQQAVPTLITWKDSNNVVHINVGDPSFASRREMTTRQGKQSILNIFGADLFSINEQINLTQAIKGLSKNQNITPIIELLQFLNKKMPTITIQLQDKVIDSQGIERDGLYNANTNTILISRNPSKPVGQVLAHEILHSLFLDKLNTNPEIKQQLETIIAEAKSVLGETDLYGLTSVEEFLSEIFTEGKLIKALSNIEGINNKKASNALLNKIRDWFNKCLNLIFKEKPSLLDNALYYIEQLMSSNTEYYTKEQFESVQKTLYKRILTINSDRLSQDASWVSDQLQQLKEEFPDFITNSNLDYFVVKQGVYYQIVDIRNKKHLLQNRKTVNFNVIKQSHVGEFASQQNESVIEKPEITEPNIPKTNIQGEEVDQQITITHIDKFIPEYGNIYKVDVENLVNELTLLDELKLNSNINLKDLILLPEITESNIPLIAKLCASPYFNKSKQGVKTIELTDEALQKVAKKHSRILKYKYDKETDKITITVPKSFIVGYTQEEIDMYYNHEALMNIQGISPIKLKSFAKATMFQASDYVTRILEQDPDVIEELNITEEELKKCTSRIDVLNTISLGRILNHIKEQFFDNHSGDLIEVCQAISNNWNAFTELGFLELMQLEKIALNQREVFQESNIALDIFDTANEQEIQEIFGSSVETWQIGFRQMSVFSGLSQMIKQRLHTLMESKLDQDGDLVPVLNELGMFTAVDATMATASILKWTRYSTSLEQMIDKLKQHQKEALWLQPLIQELEETDDEQFKASFFTNFCKYFQPYVINFVDKDGVAKSKAINENEYADTVIQNLITAFKQNRNNLFITSKPEGIYKVGIDKLYNAINATTLQNIDIDKVINWLQIGFNIPFTGKKEALLTLLQEGHNWDNFKTHMLAIIKNAQGAKKPKEYNPLNSSNLSDYKGILSVLEQVVPTNIESVSYSDGKLHYSYVIPSYLNILCGKISGHLQGLYTDAKDENERYQMFLQDEFGQYSWFKNRKTGKWLNNWLQRLATDSKARETFKHIAVLTKDKISYVDKNSAQYAASLIFQYFANGINSNKAYFRLAMMSNKPSEEYIQFFKTQVEEIPSILANTVFLQELERILGCKERANTILNPNSPNYHPECGIKAFDKNGQTFQFLEYLSVFLDTKQYNQTYDTLLEDIKPIYQSLKLTLDKYFSGKPLTDEENLQMIKDVEKVIKYNMELKLNNYMQSLIQNGLLVAENSKYKITDPALQKMDIFQTSDQIEKYLKEYFYNDVFATMQILQLTVTDKAFYKDDDDLQKRLAQLHAPVMRGYIQVKDFSTGERVSDGTYRSIILKDDVIKADILTNLHQARTLILSQITDPVIKQKTEMFLKDAISAFEEVNFADAQSFQTPTALRKKLHMFGKWTQEMEDAYNRIMSGAPYGEVDVNVLWQPLKPFVYGMKQQNSYSSMGTIRSGVQFKNSEYTLVLADAILRMANMPNKLQAIYDVLEATHHTKNADNTINMMERTTNGIDSCQFESTFKAGLTGIIDITDKGISKYIQKNSDKIEQIKQQLLESNPWLANNEMLLDSYLKTEVVKHILQDAIYNASDKTESGYNTDYVQELSFDCYGLQQEVPSHFRHEQQMGSQMRALIIADTPNINPVTGKDNYVVIDGKRITVKDAKEKYMSAIVNNINLSRQEIEEELNLTSNNQQLKDLALSRLLRKTILEDGRYGADALWGVTINPETGTFNRPLSDPTQLDMIEKMLNSIVKNRIHKQKIAGGPCVQVTNFGTSDELHIRYKTVDILNEDGSIKEIGKLLFTEQEFNALKGLKRVNRENAEKVISQRVARHLDEYVWDNTITTYKQYVEKYQNSPAYYECYAPIYAEWLRDKQFLDKNGNINVDKVVEANPKALQMIGYRIPTEAKYSMCPIKIVGFLPVTAGEGIMLPKELTTLSGSDFDVDKMYIMRYDFDVRHENGKLVLKTPNSQKTKNDNYLIDTAFGFLTNPLTEQEQFTPGGFEDVKRYAYLIAAYQTSQKSWDELQQLDTDSLKKLAKTNENLIYPQTQIAYHKQNMVAAKLIGVFAVANVSHAFMALGEGAAEINCKFYDKVITINNHQFGYVGINKKGKPEVMRSFNIDPIYGYSGERVSRILAQLLAASVDAVKDPVLNLLNINLKSVNLAVTLARMGFDIQTISLFMNQPSIKNVIEQAILNDSDLSVEIEKEINRLQNITSPNDFKIAQSQEGVIFDNEDWLQSLKNEDDLTAVKNLTLAAQLLNYSRVFSAITGVTKQNSISSAVGPTNLDNIDARIAAQKLDNYLEKERISPKTYSLAWNAISSALYYTQHALVNSLINGQTFITATNNFIDKYIELLNTVTNDKLTDKLKQKFITAYTGSAIVPNWNQIEFISSNPEYSNNPLKAMVLNYPAEFINKKSIEYLKQHPENKVVKMLMEMSNVENLDINLPLDNPSLMDELQVHCTEIMTNNPQLAKELILYTYARGGWGFNVKFPLSKLFTTEVLKEVDGYFDQLRDVSEVSVSNDFMMQFKLNNHISDVKIYLTSGIKSTVTYIDDMGREKYTLHYAGEQIPLEYDKIYQIVTDTETYLIRLNNEHEKRTEQYATGVVKDIEYKQIPAIVEEIFFLGDGNDVFEYGEYVDPTQPIKQSKSIENTETKQDSTSKPVSTVENSFSTNPMFDNAITALQSLLSENVNEILNSAQVLNSLSAEQIEQMQSMISNPIERQPTLSLAIQILNAFVEYKIPLSKQILKEFQIKKDLLNLC